jgi:hypothetical protein
MTVDGALKRTRKAPVTLYLKAPVQNLPQKLFSTRHSVKNGSRAHPASSPMGTGGSFPGGKATWK